MKKSKFIINTPNLKFSIGERTIILNNELTDKDAKLISDQYPEGNYISWPAEKLAEKPE